jgi:hypothetical protein
VTDSEPPPDPDRIDVAILDMNHSWPNVGHDSLVHAVLEAVEEERPALVAAGLKIRVQSFDVRRRMAIPPSPNGRFRLYIGTGGPGHLDPRRNDGVAEWTQGVVENPEWEAPLFRLFDDILAAPGAALIAVCHTFGLMCRWSGMARPELRRTKSSGMPLNVLSAEAVQHPWFQNFATALDDHQHFRVIDNRLFDLVVDKATRRSTPLAYEDAECDVLTMAEFARDPDGSMPRMLGVNHHPEIIDREHLMAVLDEKRAHGEVSETWYQERANTLANQMRGTAEQESRVTSYYTLLAPLRHHLTRLIEQRAQATTSS